MHSNATDIPVLSYYILLSVASPEDHATSNV